MLYKYKCDVCNIDFQRPYKRANVKYCSRSCQHIALTKNPSPRKCACGCGTIIKRKRFPKNFPKSYVAGHQFKGKLNTNWNNGQYITAYGYVFLQKPEHPNSDKRGYVREHVFIMSKHLGRPLTKNELVHHINGIRNDNRIDNLIIMTRQQHASHHHKGLIKPNSLKNLNTRTI